MSGIQVPSCMCVGGAPPTRTESCSPDSLATTALPAATAATMTTSGAKRREKERQSAMRTPPRAASGTSTTTACTTSECTGSPDSVSKSELMCTP